MRRLIKATDQRRLALIELLLDVDGWVTIPDLAQQLNSSIRVLKEDIVFIRQIDSNIQFETGPKGVRILIDYSTGIRDYYYLVLKSTLPFQLLEEIFFNEKHSVSELATTLHTSYSTIYRTIEQLNEYFSEFDCRIESNPCRIVGDERYIRNIYRAYFKEVSTVLEWPFRDFDEAIIDDTFEGIVEFLKRFSDIDTKFMDFAIYETVKILITVSIIRYQHGHLVDTTDEESIVFSTFFNALKLFVLPNNLKYIGGQTVNTEFVYQLFYPYLKKDIAYGIDALKKLQKKNSIVNHAVSYLETYLRNFSNEMAIDIDLDSVIASIYGTTYLEDDDPNAYYILNNRNKLFTQRIKHQYPNIYQLLYNGIIGFRKRLNKPLDDDKIHLLLFTLVTTWDNLLVELQTKFQKVSLLIISDGHYSHSKMIQNFLSFELRNNVSIETYQNREISYEKLNSCDHDLVVSTFKLPEFDDKETIIIEHYPSFQDINRIEGVINKIIERKSAQLIEDNEMLIEESSSF